MWIYPTYNRPKQCQAVLEQIVSVGCSTPGMIIVQGEESKDEYNTILAEVFKNECFKNWSFIITSENLGLCGALNLAYSLLPEEPFYGVITDDEFVFTQGWDIALATAAGDWNIAHGDNRWQSEVRCHGYMTLGGKLVRTVGYIMPPGLWHWYSDNVWEHIAAELALRKFCRDIILEDRHYISGKSPFDETYKMGESKKHEDEQIFRKWLADSPQLIQKIRDAMPKNVFSFV